jgi:hypothetical protein
VSGRVQRHQAEKFADRDQQIYANRAEGWNEGAQQAYPSPVQYAPAPAQAPAGDDLGAKLKQLGDLHDQGVLTDEEFSSAKSKLLGA